MINTIIMGEWNIVVGDESYRNIVGHMDSEGEIREIKLSLISVKKN